MGELTRDQKKDFAKNLYLNSTGITQKEVALRVGVSVVTLSKWVTKEKWENLRTSLLVSKSEILSDYYRQLKEAKNAVLLKDEGQRFMTSKEADAVSKITSCIRNLETETNIAEKVEVGKEFLVYVRKVEGVEGSKKIAALFDSYIKSCM